MTLPWGCLKLRLRFLSQSGYLNRGGVPLRAINTDHFPAGKAGPREGVRESQFAGKGKKKKSDIQRKAEAKGTKGLLSVFS